MARKKLVAGNWKMYKSAATARALAQEVAAGAQPLTERVDVLVCPPFPYLSVVGEVLKGSPVMLGAQNCFHENEGAFTGEVSPTMLLDVGCQYVILGHSERRHELGETDDLIGKKVKRALEAGLRVILCVGETRPQRDAGETEKVLEAQFHGSLAGVPPDKVSQLLLAYEPVWAIGKGQSATPEQAQEAHTFLRRQAARTFGEEAAARLLILYGGSVKPENAAKLVSLPPDVDGGLIGSASLKADAFLVIVEAAARA